ncbi:hypothetical protein SeMB42_g05862 [Synchytrium endobioticum]|uniref:SAGA-associated factor 11 n=1 Tax=Synchytrium endobioticum TaxID=286115 RepID=A0A507CNT9_9FUNG|nr:hypothetical protein SeMB42_g05862 [Synchytrium endobioticum]
MATDKLSSMSIFDNMVEEVMMEVIFESHREAKLATSICQICLQQCRCFVQAPNKDVFGQELQTKSSNDQTSCPKCGKVIATMKFMYHLEGCMGLGFGRQSSRVASRRIQDAANGSQGGRAASSSPFDSESDKEGSATERKRRRKKGRNDDSDVEYTPGDLTRSKSPSPAKPPIKLKIANKPGKPPRPPSATPSKRTAMSYPPHLPVQRSSSTSSGVSDTKPSPGSRAGRHSNQNGALDTVDQALFKQQSEFVDVTGDEMFRNIVL